MKFTIAQIGENRLKRVLVDDKQSSPEKICDALKSDLITLLESYMDEPNVVIQTSQNEEDDIIFNVLIKTKRVKQFGVLAV